MDSFGKTWLESAVYMEAVNKEEDSRPIPKGHARSERVQTLAEVNRRIDRHLYSMVVWAELAKELGKSKNTAGVVVCGSKVMEHLNTIAKLSNEDIDQKLMDLVSNRLESVPVKTVEALRSEILLRVKEASTLLGRMVRTGDHSKLDEVKSSQDKLERIATLLGEDTYVAFAREQKGSCYAEAAAEEIYGPNEALDQATRMEKLLVATDLSPDDLLEILAKPGSFEN